MGELPVIKFSSLYGGAPGAGKRAEAVKAGLSSAFGPGGARFFRAPGRTELGGNHTDHQNGRALAAAISRDILAAARPNGTGTVRIRSGDFDPVEADLANLTPDPAAFGRPEAIVRGVAAQLLAEGYPLGGFDAFLDARIPAGAGLSSSAAFEALTAAIFCGLFGGGKTPEHLPRLCQIAENRWFGKACGLMDQLAVVAGGAVFMDFYDLDLPETRPIDPKCFPADFVLCLVNTGEGHGDLTESYEAVSREMGAVAAALGRNLLSRVREGAFYAALPALRRSCGDRAVLRAMHFFDEQRRVSAMEQALTSGDFGVFLKLVRDSGDSSWKRNQNVFTEGRQSAALGLVLCERLLAGRGACRIHGGGFAGAIQAWVPADMAGAFAGEMELVFGAGSCLRAEITPYGVCEAEEGA